jgi:thiamine-phosphate pyrophosphorylase
MTGKSAAQPARFYMIVPDAAWVVRLAPLGIATMQLRLKDAGTDETRRQIELSLSACRAHGVQLVVNDHWQAAIDAGADYVHLGQEDLAIADLPAIRRAGMRIGLSTHDEAELEIALAARPDYVALGPIYETKLKAMRFGPQGLDRIRQWKDRIGGLPLVAIGGLTPERAPGVLAAGADSLAAVTDVTLNENPEQRVRLWLATVDLKPGPG